MNRIAVQALETPLQALDAVHGGIVAWAVAGLYRAIVAAWRVL